MQKARIFFITLIACLFMTGKVLAFQPFPDTGQIMCYDASDNKVPCQTIEPGDPYYGQDGHYQPRLPRSYTKLGHGGVELDNDELHVDDGGSWIMTRDNVTGLIWELKRTESPHLQNKDNTYSWYDPDPETNAGHAGTRNQGDCEDSDCDTYSFIQTLNEQQFGGYSDWRIPSREELSSLVSKRMFVPAIDPDFFPNKVSSSYWSSTTSATRNALFTNLAWRVDFFFGLVTRNFKSETFHVRAVRGDSNG